MPAHAAVGVDDDLAAGEAGVAVRAADHETAGGIDVVLGLRNPPWPTGMHRVDDVLLHLAAQLLGGDLGAVLRGDDHGFDAPAARCPRIPR